ncbi:hypothetical protein Lal_00046433 [Lupinus albus]|nr:hypothetical protein Lal_00046433 [Lupinus albus]
MVGMRKDPKVGGGVSGTCEVAKNQTQHSPRILNLGPYMPPPIQQQRQQQVINNPPPAPSEPSLEDLVRQMIMQNIQFQQETRVSIQRKESSIKNLTTQRDKWPLCGTHCSLRRQSLTFTPDSEPENTDDISRQIPANKPSSSAAQQPPSIRLPFLLKIIPSKNIEEVEKDILDEFRKAEVSIPLLEAIKYIPRYAKFLEDVCTHKRKLKDNEKISMGKNVSTLIVFIHTSIT